MSDDTQYIEQQFAKLGRGGFRLKLSSNDDETKWLSVSPAAVEKIKQILIEDERES